jgi:hypothetical protein
VYLRVLATALTDGTSWADRVTMDEEKGAETSNETSTPVSPASLKPQTEARKELDGQLTQPQTKRNHWRLAPLVVDGCGQLKAGLRLRQSGTATFYSGVSFSEAR